MATTSTTPDAPAPTVTTTHSRRVFFIRGYDNDVVDPAAAAAFISAEYVTPDGEMRPWNDDLEIYVLALDCSLEAWVPHIADFVDTELFFFNCFPPAEALDTIKDALLVTAFMDPVLCKDYMKGHDWLSLYPKRMTDSFGERKTLAYIKKGLSWNFARVDDSDETFMGVPLTPLLDVGSIDTMQCSHDANVYKNKTLRQLYDFVAQPDLTDLTKEIAARELDWLTSHHLNCWIHEEPADVGSTLAKYIVTQVGDHTEITRVMHLLFYAARTGKFGDITPTTYFVLYVHTKPGQGFWSLRCVSRNVADPWTIPSLAPHLCVYSRVARITPFVPAHAFEVPSITVKVNKDHSEAAYSSVM